MRAFPGSPIRARPAVSRMVRVARAEGRRDRLTARKRTANAVPGESVAGGFPTRASRGTGAVVAAVAGPAAAADAASSTAERVAFRSPRTRPYGRGRSALALDLRL